MVGPSSHVERKSTLVEASAPGKLFIAGEYAVVTAGHPAILIAVDQFITVRLEEADGQGTIHSSLTGGLPIPWTREGDSLAIDDRENPFVFITEAVVITEQYVKEQHVPLRYFHLSVKSQLDNAHGKKYGLGSSGAVTVATIKALLQFYALPYTNELVYKLASLAHLSVKSNGSFGDIAASSYTGWIAYSCFDREWVLQKQEESSITALLEIKWPNLRIERLPEPEDLRLLIGWTGSPASTAHLVDKVNQKRSTSEQFYQQFLEESKEVVNDMIKAFHNQDAPAIKARMEANRRLLQSLTAHTGVVIETPLLASFIEMAEEFGGAAKSSGAGGGDCGVVLMDRKADYPALLAKWKKTGIQQLPVSVYQEKLMEVDVNEH